jgi:hypothetical protein
VPAWARFDFQPREKKMKTLKAAVMLMLLAATGCKQSADGMLAAHATQLDSSSRSESHYAYSGANIPNNTARSQVFEYH